MQCLPKRRILLWNVHGKLYEYTHGSDGNRAAWQRYDPPEREALYRKAARRICEIAKSEAAEREKFRLRNILNEKAVKNAFAVDMAMGGSSNTVLHMLAIAKEADVDFNLADINAISKRVSHIAKISPSLTTVHMEDINKAGGVSAVMHEMRKRGDDILLDNLTITGESLMERIKDAKILAGCCDQNSRDYRRSCLYRQSDLLQLSR